MNIRRSYKEGRDWGFQTYLLCKFAPLSLCKDGHSAEGKREDTFLRFIQGAAENKCYPTSLRL